MDYAKTAGKRDAYNVIEQVKRWESVSSVTSADLFENKLNQLLQHNRGARCNQELDRYT